MGIKIVSRDVIQRMTLTTNYQSYLKERDRWTRLHYQVDVVHVEDRYGRIPLNHEIKLVIERKIGESDG